MPRDWKKWPELRNSEFDFYYIESPHKQITEDFFADVVEVHDGDTITLRTDFRDFNFPLRFLNINTPELSEERGEEIRDWLKDLILGEEVWIFINPKNRVDKWGRLLGRVLHRGMFLDEIMVLEGKATPF